MAESKARRDYFIVEGDSVRRERPSSTTAGDPTSAPSSMTAGGARKPSSVNKRRQERPSSNKARAAAGGSGASKRSGGSVGSPSRAGGRSGGDRKHSSPHSPHTRTNAKGESQGDFLRSRRSPGAKR